MSTINYLLQTGLVLAWGQHNSGSFVYFSDCFILLRDLHASASTWYVQGKQINSSTSSDYFGCCKPMAGLWKSPSSSCNAIVDSPPWYIQFNIISPVLKVLFSLRAHKNCFNFNFFNNAKRFLWLSTIIWITLILTLKYYESSSLSKFLTVSITLRLKSNSFLLCERFLFAQKNSF